jgi:hypothetical protein
VLFHEEQRFSPAIIGIVLLIVAIAGAMGLLVAPSDQMGARLLALLIPIGIAGMLFLGFKLVTKVRPGEVEYGFPLGLRRTLPREQIARVEVIEYRPLRDFGGWGLRFGRQGMMYNARGNRAVKLNLTNGKVLFIGSQQPEQLASASWHRGRDRALPRPPSRA